jgi:hypothetical protein
MAFAELLPDYIQAFALVAAGAWTYWTFFRQRGNEPATDIDVDAIFVGVHGEEIVLEVIATLDNKSLVRHRYQDFRVNVRYLLPGDELVDGGDDVFHQLLFPNTIDERISKRRYFANSEYINPRQSFKHRYETFVPGNATFVRVHCRFSLGTGRGKEYRQRLLHRRVAQAVTVDSQRVLAVPAELRRAGG